MTGIKGKTGVYERTQEYKEQSSLRSWDEKNPNWKGDNVSYWGLHKWIYTHKGKAIICSKCNSIKAVQWANKSHEYKRDLDDWFALCRKCHHAYDRISEKRWDKFI